MVPYADGSFQQHCKITTVKAGSDRQQHNTVLRGNTRYPPPFLLLIRNKMSENSLMSGH